MKKTTMGAIVAALSLAVSGYTALVASAGAKPKLVHTVLQRSPADIAARDRMAKMVAEVAARTAAQTAKSVTMSRLHAQQQARPGEQKTASR